MGVTPRITVGMSEAAVEQLLGKPKAKRGGDDLMASLNHNVSGNMSGISARQYALYQHSAGSYQLVLNDGMVVEVNAQPAS